MRPAPDRPVMPAFREASSTPRAGAVATDWREQAREIGRHQEIEATRGPGMFNTGRTSGANSAMGAGAGGGSPTSTLLDRPLAPALARRLAGQGPVVSEKMVGGAWEIRFKNGGCLHIPLQVPHGQESQVVPNEWVMTNCPD